MMESWVFDYQGKSYPCEITFKRMRSVRFRFSRDGSTFLISCPYGTSRDYLRQQINKYLPKMLHFTEYEKPVNGDTVYLFGDAVVVPGFGSWESKKQQAYLKKQLLPFLNEQVLYYRSLMGVKTPYSVHVRDMSSRYGVNNKSLAKLTFTTSLVHYSPSIIISVVVHELAHDAILNHSSAFYAIVYKYCPTYALAHAKLRKHQYHE
jgi:predicted metal-dependent hydrolase